MTSKKPITHPALASWAALNEFVMATTDPTQLSPLLDAELKGRRRAMFVRRLRSRLNRLQAQAAMAKIEEALK